MREIDHVLLRQLRVGGSPVAAQRKVIRTGGFPDDNNSEVLFTLAHQRVLSGVFADFHQWQIIVTVMHVP